MIEIIKKAAKLISGEVSDENKDISKQGNIYMLIVGVDYYETSSNLHYCRQDSSIMRDLIYNKTNKQLKEKNIFELYDQDATKINILDNLKNLNDVVSENDILIIFISGWSINSIDSNFFVPHDGDKQNLFSNISNAYFNDFFRKSKSKDSILINNTCYYGSGRLMEDENLGKTSYSELIKNSNSLFESLVSFLTTKREGVDRNIWHFSKRLSKKLEYKEQVEIFNDEKLVEFVKNEHEKISSLIDLNRLNEAMDRLFKVAHNNDTVTRDQLNSLMFFYRDSYKSKEYFNEPIQQEEGKTICHQLLKNVYDQGYYLVPVESTYETRSKEEKHVKKILFTSSDTMDHSRLRLDEEYNAITLSLLRAKKRDDFELIACLSSRIEDLQRNLLENRPYIVHFSGHGTSSGICMVDNEKGTTKLIKSEPLSRLFKLFASSLECVFLNSCHSKGQSTEISKHVNSVICMNNTVNDSTAIKFASSFYVALGNGENIEFAFEFAKNSIELNNLDGMDIPELLLSRK